MKLLTETRLTKLPKLLGGPQGGIINIMVLFTYDKVFLMTKNLTSKILLTGYWKAGKVIDQMKSSPQ